MKISPKNKDLLNQWSLVTLGTTLIWISVEEYQTLIPCSQSINWLWQVKPHNCRPHHDFTQACGRSKSMCTVWIQPIDSFLSHPGTSIRVNESLFGHWTNTGQKSTKYFLGDELEVYFSLIKTINFCQQVWTSNRNPCRDLTQSCGGVKSVCPGWIQPTDNFLPHLSINIRIDKFWSDQWKQISQKPNKIRLKLKLEKTYFKVKWRMKINSKNFPKKKALTFDLSIIKRENIKE